jgi:hypothetical protein
MMLRSNTVYEIFNNSSHMMVFSGWVSPKDLCVKCLGPCVVILRVDVNFYKVEITVVNWTRDHSCYTIPNNLDELFLCPDNLWAVERKDHAQIMESWQLPLKFQRIIWEAKKWAKALQYLHASPSDGTMYREFVIKLQWKAKESTKKPATPMLLAVCRASSSGYMDFD